MTGTIQEELDKFGRIEKKDGLWWGYHPRRGWVVLDEFDGREKKFPNSRHLFSCEKNWAGFYISREEFGKFDYKHFSNYILSLRPCNQLQVFQKLCHFRQEFLARRDKEAAAVAEHLVAKGLTAVTVGPATIEKDSIFRQIEPKIDVLLQQRGFLAGTKHPDCTCWSRESLFWDFEGDLWSLANFQGGVVWFGVEANLIREALSRALVIEAGQQCDPDDLDCVDYDGPDDHTLGRLLALARATPGLPAPLQQLRMKFTRMDREYLAIQIEPTFGIVEVRKLIVELVNAFVVYMEGGQPWGPKNTVEGVAEPGIPCLKTEPMPDPDLTPYHSLSLMAKHIFPHLRKRGYGRTNHKGSVSWAGPIGSAGHGVAFKLCYFGPHDWLFGVNRDLVTAHTCLQCLMYDCTFHIMPITQKSRPVYRGFQVFDTQASYTRVREVLDCV